MSEGATRAANLSPEEKRELLARLLRRRAGGQKTAPASFSQQRLWFIDQLEPGSAAYNIPSGVKLTGPLDTSALAESLNDIARRHETLRTTFATSGGEPVQVIHPHLPLDVPCLDLTRLPAAEREEEARRLAAEEAQRPFDLARGPLWRASLVKLSPEEHVLLLTMHHIVSDGWSTGVLVEELAELYAARREGREASLPGLAVQYADYARWQHQHLAGEELERQLGYWREQLAGAPAVLELPTDRPRPPVQTFRGGSARLTIPARPYRALGELCEREEVTLFMALLAAFKTLLYRHTGQTDIVVGTPSAGRTRAEIERLIGFFINTLVLRTRLSGNPTFRELLGRVREVALGAYAYQDLPFEKLVEELHPERDLSRTPLVQVMFNLLKFAGQRIELPRLTVESLAPPEAGAKFDLTLYARELGDELELEFVYNADLFEHSTIEAMLARLGTLLEGAVANPEERLKRLPLLGHAERQRLAAAANTVRPSNPFVGFGAEEVEQSIARRFARQAAAHPSRVAVKTKSAEWTYAALDRFSDRVARAVLGLRGGGEERVALLFEHGDLMIAGILGALKAGKTYVPLDCSYPLPRISHMLEDSGAVAVVTNRRNLGLARELAAGSLPVVNVEDLGGVDDGPPPALEVPPDRPAYILYTSGSTGRPKGVVQSHRNVLRHIRNYTNNLHLCADDRLLLVASYSFDAAVMDIYGALLNGASLFAYDIKEEGFDGLAADLAAEGVTVYHSTPTVYRYFLNTLPAAAGFPRLRLVVLGGEEVFKRDFELFRRHFAPGCIFVNGLGPTESTVTLQYFLDHGSELRRNSVPVGYAVEGTEVLLLDEDGEAVEGCGVGEIAVRSAHLALGYWRQPGLTQAVFLPDRDDAATRVYRTGDVGRLLPDGSLEFIGRKDFQVKIRGQRVEVGEIETALLAHAGVREAVVLAVASGANDRRLAAYVVPAPAAAPAPAELRAHLKSKLPDYMVPSTFDLLDALPLTPNGKVDRRALPAPSAEGLARDGDSEGPATPVEELLAGIWAEVLGVERVGRSDNFFELGGHSLLATQIVSRVRRAFSAELPLRRLFESPTVAALAEAVERELRAGARAELPPVSPAPRDEPLPLSYAQQRLWFINQLEPGNAAYNIPSAVRLAGELNAAALEGALTEVARRHETLRTSFPAEGGRPVQVISPPAPVTLDTVDLSQLPAAEREEEARRLAAEEAQRPFDLSRGPLWRASLVKLADDEHVLLLTMHHIVSDGWSVGLLVSELSTLYSAYARGEEPSLPELQIQYADYAAWQREHLSGEALDAQLAYWRERLSGAPPVLELPTDRPRPAVQTYRGSRLTIALGEEVSRGLHQLARAEGATAFMVLLAAFDALLHRYTNQTDILVGTPVAGRTRSETESLVGCFVNTLVLRTRVRGGETFRELLGRVREACLGAYAHQDAPFERVVEELQPERSLSHAPLFQVMFAFNNTPRGAAELPGLRLEAVEAEEATAQFDLSLIAAETRDGIAARFEYSTDLFDEPTVERMAGHFRRLLEAALADPSREVGELELLGEGEQRLLREWNETAAQYPRLCVHELIEQQVKRTPDAVAVEFEGERLTYAELDARANRLARHLRGLGVGPDELVAVMLERSAELVVSLLAVWKAGGAYVPLDPEYPAERLRFMLEDSRARVLITESALASTLPEGGARVVMLDVEQEEVARHSADTLPGWAAADNLAYVIYTSGSTGRPKGAMNQHGALANRLLWMQHALDLSASDAVLQKTTFSFDVSAWELFWPLAAGARLVVAAPGGHRDPSYLADVIARAGVTTLHFVPPMLGAFLDAAWPEGSCAGLRRVVCSGEALGAGLVERFYTRLPARLYNLYGPTEAAIDVSWWECASGAARPSVPIGRPVWNTRLHVLDSRGRPAPVGVAGELHIGGVQVGRGYRGRAGLTAERFVPDPFSGEPGARLYRTGDVARWVSGGVVEYLGRRDGQVKVRGFRVEVGEIEAALLSHGSVRECAVAARGEGEARHLVGYVVAEGEGGVDASELREHLRERLPAYMVPSLFVTLDALPLTPNGKVDRRALPEPVGAVGGEYEPPVGAVEELMAGVWAEVLGLERVGRGEDFFELGGHSLLATRLLSRVRSALGVELPLRQLFETPTVAGLAAAAERALQAGGVAETPPISRVPRSEPLPLSFAQQRLWFLGQLEPDNAAYNIPSAVRLSGELNVAALESALTEAARRHETLRTTFPSVDGRPVQLISPPAPVALDTVDLSGLPTESREEEARRLAAAEAQRAFDLAAGPLWRASLMRLSGEEHVLLVTMHHSVSDGWSIGILVEELAALYSAYARGEEPSLPELEVQYADYAAWQRELLSGEALDAQLAYWRERLLGAPPVLELPTDRPRPALQSYRGARLSFTLGPELAGRLRHLARAEGATLFMVLLAAFDALLYRYTNQTDILVGTPVAGRTRAETERLIGCFVNTLVVRAEVRGGEPFRELLRRVREACLGAYAHQEVPFERVVDEVHPERSLSHAPLFQVMFAFNNTPRGAAALPGLRMEPVEADGGTTKFDLSLSLVETGEELGGAFEYSTDLFDSGTVARLSGHFARLLEAAVADPAGRVADLPLLGDEEERLLREWNETEADYPRLCVHELIEEQVKRTPDAVAVELEGERLTYAELDARANQLARHLRGLGVGPDELVAVMLERSAELVVTLLAVWKAGGAYVPLDPEYPAERLRFMLEDSGARVLVTESGLASSVPEHGARVVMLDVEREQIAGQSADTLPGWAAADNLAYVIYTSGSTGLPKGAMNQHGALANRLLWMQHALDLSASDAVLQKTTFSFDVSAWELFWPLAAGARLVVAAPGGHRDPSYLADVIARAGVTTLHFVPPMLGAFLDAAWPEGSCAGLRRVVCSGEALGAELAARFHRRLGRARLYNLYGPTEAAIDVSWWECASGGERPSVPIGRPVWNTRLHVLDSRGRPAPVGVAGELHVGGVQVGRGYRGRAGLTAERFVPDPFSGEPGARLYRTGDVARWVSGGVVEYLGRRDGQVKVRGFRVEVGEVEAALLGHPAVGEAAVVAAGGEGEKRLVAYVVPHAGGAASNEELREHLRGRLPAYMVPSLFVTLDALPLTPNGKLDRKALPEPGRPEPASREDEPPRTPTEEVLAGIWAEVLGLERVGVRDNFFELGGDSILSIRIVAKANQAGIRLTPRQMFEQQTVAGLAEVAEVATAAAAGGEAVTGELPLTPVQQWFFEQELVDPHHFNQSAVVELNERPDYAALEGALRHLLAHHDALRLRFSREGASWRQACAAPSPEAPLTRVDVSGLNESRQEELMEAEAAKAQASLNLSEGPLMRVVLFERGGARPTRLLIVIHHLAVDHVSWQILLEDLQTAYRQLSGGGEASLPPKTTSFKRWANLLAAEANSEARRGELAYWLAESRRDVRPLATDRSEGENTAASADTVTVSLGAEETRALLQRVPEVYRTQMNEVLLAALAQSYARWSGERSLLVDLEGHGREELSEGVDLTRTVGWFTTVFPVLLSPGEAPGEGAALKTIKEQLRAVPGRGVGYGLLRYLCRDARAAGRLRAMPQAEVLFNYLGRVERAPAGGRDFEPARSSGGPTRSPRQRRRHLLELNASVAGGRLRVDWHYSANRHERATVEAWAAAFVEALRSLVAHCLSAEAGGYTPSDFPLAGLDQGQIDRMVGRERGVEDIYPLSPIQQGLLFHSLYAPEEELYFLQTCCTLRGALDLPAFERAWQMVAARHPVLRTGFVWEGLAEPLQVVRASAALPVEAHDWRDVPAELLGERLRSFYAEDRARGFDLTRGPMMRLSLLRTGEDAHEVVWSHHHLIVDGWSCPLLLRECLTLYESLRRGEPSPLPRSRPYRDYIEWLRRQDLAAAERHWRELLKGFTAPTRVARGAAADPPESYGEQRRQLSEAATSAVQTYARRNKLTLNTVTLGAWAAVIGHLSGDEDVVFGTAVAGRPATLAGVERMVGVFINMLPLRARLAPDAPVASWLGGLQEQQLRMQQFEYSPLVRVQEWSDVPGGLPLFENFLVFENYWIGDGAPQGVRASLQVSDVRHLGRENYPLSVVVAPSSELTLKVKYNDPRLGARAAARILRRLEEALVAIAGRPGLGLRELRELLTEAEREEQAAEERKLREAQRQSFRRARRKAIGGAQAEETAHYEESTT